MSRVVKEIDSSFEAMESAARESSAEQKDISPHRSKSQEGTDTLIPDIRKLELEPSHVLIGETQTKPEIEGKSCVVSAAGVELDEDGEEPEELVIEPQLEMLPKIAPLAVSNFE